jgi:uncharacterized membrane protein
MTSDNDSARENQQETHRESPIFSAVITPHRSLGRAGFLVLMATIGGVSFVAGMVFLIAGFWPIFAFFGLDVLLIYWAFRINYRAAAAYEEVTVTHAELTVCNVNAHGKARQTVLNPLWVRLDKEMHEDFGIGRLFLVSHGRRLPIAAFLGPREKESFALALSNALGEARRGPTRTVLD